MVESFQRILIPTDGSDHTIEAMDKGLSLAKMIGAEVTALYVVDQSAFSAIPQDSMITDIYTLLRGEGTAAVDVVKEKGEAMGVAVRTHVKEGSPARVIVEESETHDLIVMASHGRTGLGKILLGSVAQAVMQHADCPVMLIRVKHDAH